MPFGDAYPTPRPDDVYDADVDEMTLCALATLDAVRTKMIAHFGGYPTGKKICDILDTHARDAVARATEDD
jgi:hypothetical protein